MSGEIEVVYFFEHAARELDVACSVASLLREQGIGTEVVQWPHGFHRVAHLPSPSVVVLPFCYSERSFIPCLLEWRKAAYFNLSWEQLFYSGNQAAKSPRGQFALRHVIHHSWSDFYAGWLRERGVPPENIFVNGQPAYQLYSPPYDAYYPSRADLAKRHGLVESKQWVFFPENYNWAFYSPATMQQFISAGQGADQVREMREFCDASLRQTLEWCADLARTGDVELILRPRPATPLSEFHSFAERVLGTVPDGMHLLHAGTVREWIRSSDVVISSHSTSLIEAAVAGKPRFMLAPRPMPASLRVDWHDKVEKIRSSDELLAACGRSRGVERGPLFDWAHDRLLANGDPVAGLATHLARMARGEVARPPTVARRDVTPPGRFRLPRAVLFEARRVLRRGHRRSPSPVIEPELLADVASEREVESRIARWRELLRPRGAALVEANS